ncbi:MAG TPA: hypothetical protein VE172_13780 [Stackebrandtia sp.]|uniref:DUF5955 family protein n=1 Tax=Stackebrandtia sp. TaxID=2023065 RepID=UPI002D2D5508|nr:hypothetical protein [Stackebrandtia sp.]HZE39872.1 hypothetical protein [Stackebrandtia sp.]
MTEDEPNRGITNAGQNNRFYIGQQGDRNRMRVDAFGERATGHTGADAPAGTARELERLLADLRRLLDVHDADLADRDTAESAVANLESAVKSDAELGRIRRFADSVLKLTEPLRSFAELVAKILDVVNRAKGA